MKVVAGIPLPVLLFLSLAAIRTLHFSSLRHLYYFFNFILAFLRDLNIKSYGPFLVEIIVELQTHWYLFLVLIVIAAILSRQWEGGGFEGGQRGGDFGVFEHYGNYEDEGEEDDDGSDWEVGGDDEDDESSDGEIVWDDESERSEGEIVWDDDGEDGGSDGEIMWDGDDDVDDSSSDGESIWDDDDDEDGIDGEIVWDDEGSDGEILWDYYDEDFSDAEVDDDNDEDEDEEEEAFSDHSLRRRSDEFIERVHSSWRREMMNSLT